MFCYLSALPPPLLLLSLFLVYSGNVETVSVECRPGRKVSEASLALLGWAEEALRAGVF